MTCLLKMSLLTFYIFLNVVLLSIIYEIHNNLYIGQFIQSKRILYIFEIWEFLIYISIKQNLP